MDTEAYLLARHQIQDRLAAQRQQLLQEQETNGSHADSFSMWPIVKQLLVHDNGSHALYGGIVSAGIGYIFSRLAKRFDLIRFTPKAITRLFS